jgi:hypothetical protein
MELGETRLCCRIISRLRGSKARFRHILQAFPRGAFFLISASKLISFAAVPHGLGFPASDRMRNVVTSAAGSG